MSKYLDYSDEAAFRVGQRVHIEIKEIPVDERETTTGVIVGVDTKFFATPSLRKILYTVRIDEKGYYVKKEFRTFFGAIRFEYTTTGDHLELLQSENRSKAELIVFSLLLDKFSIDYERLISKTRKREVVQVRQLGMYLTYLFTNYSLAHIGFLFGGKDHATVLHAKKAIIDLSETNKDFNRDRESLINTMGQLGFSYGKGRGKHATITPINGT